LISQKSGKTLIVSSFFGNKKNGDAYPEEESSSRIPISISNESDKS
jgi:hypothetical protein